MRVAADDTRRPRHLRIPILGSRLSSLISYRICALPLSSLVLTSVINGPPTTPVMVLWQAVRAPRARATLHLTYIHAHTLSLHIEVCDPMLPFVSACRLGWFFLVLLLLLLLLLSSTRARAVTTLYLSNPSARGLPPQRAQRVCARVSYRLYHSTQVVTHYVVE